MPEHPTRVWIGPRQYAVDAAGNVQLVRSVKRWRTFGAWHQRRDQVSVDEFHPVTNEAELAAARAAAAEWREQAAKGREAGRMEAEFYESGAWQTAPHSNAALIAEWLDQVMDLIASDKRTSARWHLNNPYYERMDTHWIPQDVIAATRHACRQALVEIKDTNRSLNHLREVREMYGD